MRVQYPKRKYLILNWWIHQSRIIVWDSRKMAILLFWYCFGLLQPSDLSSLPDVRSIACPIRMSSYIYICYILFIIYALRVSIFMTSPLGVSVVYIRRYIYKVLIMCPFDYTAVAGSEKVGPVNQVNQTSWVVVVTPTDRRSATAV